MMVKFVPMDQARFEQYLAYAIPEYAREKVEAGNWSADSAIERSRQEFEKFLPEGINTAANTLCSIQLEGGVEVGFIWFAQFQNMPGTSFLFDFEIHSQYRRKGYAQESLAILERECKALGSDRIDLHVFGHNKAAFSLYQKAGYIVTNINMRKQL